MAHRNASICFADVFDHEQNEEWIDGAPYRKDLAPGTAEWLKGAHGEDFAGLQYVCPCGCGAIGILTIRRGDTTERPSWAWDGNFEKPTLSPSIQKTTGCRWHGHLRNGIFEEC